MREPTYGFSEHDAQPYSKLDVQGLREAGKKKPGNAVAAELMAMAPGFREWYAAFLLRERGC